MNKWLLAIGCCLFTVGAWAQDSSGLNKKDFAKYWRVESESKNYRVSFRGDTVDIVAPKGLTLWRKEKLKGHVTIEYDACVVVENEGDRLSDLNCFWMAQDPKHPEDIFKRAGWRQGIFLNCYTLRTYYLGFGGNHNSTTRFRRYDGDERGVADANYRPAILREYTDPEHLLKPNHWYHVKIENNRNHISYTIDGERIVDFRDANPLTEGWFGFRTTLSHTRITNFTCTYEPLQKAEAPLHWTGGAPMSSRPVSFGVPFDEGEVMPTDQMRLLSSSSSPSSVADKSVPSDFWPLAFWPDGSVKWLGVAAVVPGGNSQLAVKKSSVRNKTAKYKGITVKETATAFSIDTDSLTAFIPKQGTFLVDSLLHKGLKVGERMRLVCSTQDATMADNLKQLHFCRYQSKVTNVSLERQGKVRVVVRVDGFHTDGTRDWLPFTVRLYFFQGSREMRVVHSFVYDGDEHHDFIRSLGISMDVPLRDELYNRHVAFATGEGGVWSEPVQPLDGRREIFVGDQRPRRQRADESLPDEQQSAFLSVQQQQMMGLRIPSHEQFNKQNRVLLDEWAAWGIYRLSQLTADGFTIRKRANEDNPWIGTVAGKRSPGFAFIGDKTGSMSVWMQDFWESHPSSIEICGCKTSTATLTAWLWSPEAEPMDLRHYDNVAHGLNSAYEDVQEGMSTPYGIGRTTTLVFLLDNGYQGKAHFAEDVENITANSILLPTPQYLHDKQAFGVWSLPDRSNAERAKVEQHLEGFIDYYQKQIEQHRWFGFWNYGDVMHAYDAERHEWRYDVGGFAWDNTELASNMWLWYSFLRTGRADIWRMAEAMTRHTSEVDVYHLGPNAMLGTRHNVSHWGCGAKEARISQAAWNRFYYYLTTDERCGDLMTAVRDADQMLYHLDPMRLAQPQGEYPCTAPARLRIGPDWLAYAGNWMTEWERTRNTSYRDKIIVGMKSIAALPNRMFTGPLALGYDPATGIITTECDSSLLSTNHLMTIMGGFEVMNEMMRMIQLPEWNDAWLDHAARDKEMALRVKNNSFRISRLLAYAAYQNCDSAKAREAWSDLLRAMGREGDRRHENKQLLPPEVPAPQDEVEMVSTNGVSTWALDAIYMQEVIPMGR